MLRLVGVLIVACGVAAGEAAHNNVIALKEDGLIFRRISPKQYGIEAPDYYVLETEVSNRMYLRYLNETKKDKGDDEALKRHMKRKEDFEKNFSAIAFSTADAAESIIDPEWLWAENAPKKDQLDFPVAYISVEDAAAYCEYLTKKHPDLGTFRLPHVQEWVLAAYGKDRKYPWGNEDDDSRIRKGKRGKDKWGADGDQPTSPESVTARKDGRTPEGLYGMWGNVSEYCIHPANVHNAFFTGVGARWMGGGFDDVRFRPRQDYWGYWHNSEGRSQSIGFRVLLDVNDKEHKFIHRTPYDFFPEDAPKTLNPNEQKH
jgi:formylglycine-generating enzyme required for sulfatase activity